jgi:peptidyl-prolyl cis-trans isomerase A (cyclophilin A)
MAAAYRPLAPGCEAAKGSAALPARRGMIASRTMTGWMIHRRLAWRLLAPAALLLAALAPAGALAAPSEAEIQAKIEAELEAMAKAEREKAAAAAAARPAPVEPPTPAPVPAAPARVYRTVPVVITTSMGAFTVAVEVERAPVTAANFLAYVDQKRLDGTAFYRSFKWDDGTPGGFIQGGTQNDPRRILKPVPHEPTSRTGLSHVDGAISVAQGAPGTGTGDFFIIIGDMTGFDATADQPGFAAFGRVTAGMDVVRAIAGAPRSPTLGEGVMKGQMLAPAVRILTARRAPPE